LTERFLEHGNTVFAVEPNRDMREAAERLLERCSTFRSVDGRAEATGLADHSVDFVVAGQAFHWFDADATKIEFQRILRAPGWVALVWNVRDSTSTPFLLEYSQLLQRFGTDYNAIRHERIDDSVLAAFFGRGGYRTATFPNRQVVDFRGLQGRLLSSSYTPDAGEPGHDEMLTELARIFDEHQSDGRVTLEYRTTTHYGQL
jgi:SAM-dependent methyltransferase